MPKLSSSAVLTHVLSSVEYKTEVATKMAEGVFFDGKDDDDITIDQLSKEYLSGMKDAMNQKLWKRHSKARLEVYSSQGKSPEFDIGIWDNGEIDDTLKAKALQDWINSGNNKKYLPVLRQFVMSKYLGGDYMMDVWTTYDDMQIIGWAVNAD